MNAEDYRQTDAGLARATVKFAFTPAVKWVIARAVKLAALRRCTGEVMLQDLETASFEYRQRAEGRIS